MEALASGHIRFSNSEPRPKPVFAAIQNSKIHTSSWYAAEKELTVEC